MVGNQEKQLDVYNFCFIFDNTKLFDEVSTYCSGKYIAHVHVLLSSGQIKLQRDKLRSHPGQI